MQGYSNYNKEDLFKQIEKLSIEKVGGNVVTKYNGVVVNTSPVSNRYEIFDIVKYLQDKINDIEKNFNITKYQFTRTRGRQELRLISDVVNVGGIDFYKSFYILNSTDKSRRLSFNVGLYSDTSKFYIISGVRNIGLTKKHLKGVTQAAEEATTGINDETFNEQIESLNSIVGHRIKISKLREVILGNKPEIPQINHKKFDAFKNAIRFAASDGRIRITNEQRSMLLTESEKLTNISPENDFYIDAFWAFQLYLTLFNRQDSHIIKNETDRIMKITQWAVRNSVLEALGI